MEARLLRDWAVTTADGRAQGGMQLLLGVTAMMGQSLARYQKNLFVSNGCQMSPRLCKQCGMVVAKLFGERAEMRSRNEIGSKFAGLGGIRFNALQPLSCKAIESRRMQRSSPCLRQFLTYSCDCGLPISTGMSGPVGRNMRLRQHNVQIMKVGQ